MKKIRVLSLVASMGMGGAQQLLVEYLRCFKDDPEIEFCLYVIGERGDSKYDRIIQNENLNVCYMNKPPSKCKIPYIKRFFNARITRCYIDKAIKDFHPDIVHTHISRLLCQAIYPILNNKVRWCFNTLHSNPGIYKGRELYVLRKAFSKPNIIPISITEEQAILAKKRYRLKRLIIVRNGIDMERLLLEKQDKNTVRSELGIPQTAFVIGAVGRLNKVKRYDFLLYIISEIYKTNKDIYLAIAGDGKEKKELQQLSEKLGIAHRVSFLGNVEAIGKLYCSFDLFILPSKHEAGPLVLLEAQTMGVPCIISAGVPASFLVTENVWQMQKKASIQDWCETIIEKKYLNSGFKCNDLCEFDIKYSLKRMREIYLNYGSE